MKKKILQQAFEELNDAIAYYEEQQAGLGLRLKDEVDRHVRWIIGNPDIPRIRRGGYRRVNLKTFPYYIGHLSKKANNVSENQYNFTRTDSTSY